MDSKPTQKEYLIALLCLSLVIALFFAYRGTTKDLINNLIPEFIGGLIAIPIIFFLFRVFGMSLDSDESIKPTTPPKIVTIANETSLPDKKPNLTVPGEMKPLSLLKSFSIIRLRAQDQRQLLPIAVIDDEKFGYADLLKQYKFDVTELGDIADIKIVSAYSIIICDIQGVGKSFKSSAEGGYLIKEIRRRYPEKYIIAYSGGTFNPTYKKYFDDCDATIQKDADIEEWINILDKAVQETGDPVNRWVRLRGVLLSSGMELNDMLTLEQAYIKSVTDNNPSHLKAQAQANSAFNQKELLIDAIAPFAPLIKGLHAAHLVNEERHFDGGKA
jgi:hypothetical protein